MSSYNKWIPFELACRLHCLQQGSLGAGNTQQNKATLLALVQANANTNGGNVPGGGGTYGRWSQGANKPASNCQPVQSLEVFPANVPGFVKPIAS
jgi:hypothetical protein